MPYSFQTLFGLKMNIRTVIDDEDLIGRAIFSSQFAKQAIRSGVIRYRVFLEKLNRPISVDRFGFCLKKTHTDIQNKNARLRSTSTDKRSFYGWATIKAIDVKKNSKKLKSSPILGNPYHADIYLPKNIERDEQIMHAKELATRSSWTPKYSPA